jgi:hypothetical protein
MGLFDFFKNRRDKESAVHLSADSTETSLGSFASPEGQEVVGKQVAGTPGWDVQGMSGADGLAMLAQLGPMIQQAMATGNVQITQGEPQVLDLRGTGLREEIMGIMGQHGIDPKSGVTGGESVNAANYGDMQKQILEALAKHGVPTGLEPPSGEQPPQPSSGS